MPDTYHSTHSSGNQLFFYPFPLSVIEGWWKIDPDLSKVAFRKLWWWKIDKIWKICLVHRVAVMNLWWRWTTYCNTVSQLPVQMKLFCFFLCEYCHCCFQYYHTTSMIVEKQEAKRQMFYCHAQDAVLSLSIKKSSYSLSLWLWQSSHNESMTWTKCWVYTGSLCCLKDS